MATSAPATETAPISRHGGASLTVEVLSSFSAAEVPWRDLETRAILTPYQSYDWITALHRAGADQGREIAIAIIRRQDQPIALLPLGLRRRWSVTTAHFLGTAQSNTDWMLLDPGFSPSAAQLLALFAEISKRVGGIDLLSFQNQVQAWNSTQNPLLQLPHVPAASNFYATLLGGTPKPFIEHRLAPKRRGDLKRSRRRMEEAMGTVELIRVAHEPMLDRVHAAFLEQRRIRFDEMGINNVFEGPMFRRFFRDAAIASFGAPRPTIVVHALMGGGEVTATAWGTTQGDHYSLYINSTQGGDASKFSLMHILIADLMDELIDMGITSFDIGLGDFSYKTRWTEAEPVFNGLIPLSGKGRLVASALASQGAIKRTIKQNPRLWATATRIRRLLHRIRPGN